MPTLPKSVLLVTSTFPRSPDDPVTARFVLDLASHLAEHTRVAVLAPGAPGAPSRSTWGRVTVVRHRYFAPARLQKLTAGEGILANVRGSRLARAQLPLLVASQWAAIPRVARAEGAELINSHWLVPQGFNVALWRKRLRVAHVATAHAADVAWLRRASAGRRVARRIFDDTDLFLPVSSELAREVEELLGRPVSHRVVPMGVSVSAFRPGVERDTRAAQGARTVLFVGKLVPKKGVHVLLEALARLRARGLDVRAVLVGGGPLEPDVRGAVHRLGLDGAVELRGWMRNDELPPLFATADVVCVPSVRDERGETEGMPVVVQEALASGAVVVASGLAGIPDVVRDGENGWLSPPGDPERLAETIARALAMDPARARALRERARATALDHSWERVAERYLEAFAAALSSGRGGRP